MHSPLARKFSLVVVVAFLASLATWGFDLHRAAHDHSHVAAAHAAASDSPSDSRDPKRDADHERMHALGQIQPCPIFALGIAATVPPGVVRSAFVDRAVEPSAADPPFRPPRASSALA